MKDTGSKTTRILLDVMENHGIDTIVLSPGSRNAPILISASQRDSLKKYIIPDERTAAFVALGMALQSQRPVALACTSGTAMYNYAPAIAEAYYQHIPLIVITADRPSQWIDQDDSQTLRQFRSLDNIVKGSFNLPVDSMAVGCANPDFHNEGNWFANRTVNEAILLATEQNPGPVHINIQLDTPLGAIEPRTLPHGEYPYPERVIRRIAKPQGLPSDVIQEIAGKMAGKKIMLVAGFMAPDAKLNEAVNRFITLPNVTALAETISNLEFTGYPYLIDGILTRLSKEELEELRPDIVISIGGALVSRMLKEYLRKCVGTEHWTLGDSETTTDCFQRLTLHIETPPADFLAAIPDAIQAQQKHAPEYGAQWLAAKCRILPKYLEDMASGEWCELQAIKELCDTLPKNSNLFLSNGTPIRYAQLCMQHLPNACYGNRGVSGIDGTNATAMGVAMKYDGPTILLTGDISFSYCPQILALGEKDADLRIIVINNSGGGIFRFISTTRDLEMREEFFCAPAEVPLKALANAYGWNYLQATNHAEMCTALNTLYNTRRSILEIVVDPELSAKKLVEFLRTK